MQRHSPGSDPDLIRHLRKVPMVWERGRGSLLLLTVQNFASRIFVHDIETAFRHHAAQSVDGHEAIASNHTTSHHTTAT